MKRDFLRGLGIEDEDIIKKILDENMSDIGKEKNNTKVAQDDLKKAKSDLESAQADLEALKKSDGDISKLHQDLKDLQEKYENETADLKGQLSARDYSDAITRAISEKGLKFSSKSAQTAFIAALKEKQLELNDGSLTGIDDFISAQKEADPDAFAPEKTAPRFVTGYGIGGAGGHGTPTQTMSRAATLAAQYHQNQYGTTKE